MASVQSSLHIGFVSTQFSGTGGVSLETEKWADVLEPNEASTLCLQMSANDIIVNTVGEIWTFLQECRRKRAKM